VAYNLKVLEQRGVLRREGKVSRGISIPKTDVVPFTVMTAQVPLLGTITAGQPLPDPEDLRVVPMLMSSMCLQRQSSNKLHNVYALKVRGYSMIDALIGDGDIVLLRYQETAEQGDMVAARIISGMPSRSNASTAKATVCGYNPPTSPWHPSTLPPTMCASKGVSWESCVA
jgi:repressor LexA